MTKEQIESLDILPVPISNQDVIMFNSALEWILGNTVLKFDINNVAQVQNLPYSVKLFVLKFLEVNSVNGGVTSESISGLSQSFNTTSNKEDLIWQYAQELLSQYLVAGSVRFVESVRRW